MWVVGAYKSKLSKRVVCALWKFYVPVNALYTVSICASYCHWHGRVQYSVLSEGVRIPKTAPVSKKNGSADSMAMHQSPPRLIGRPNSVHTASGPGPEANPTKQEPSVCFWDGWCTPAQSRIWDSRKSCRN